MQPSYLPWKGYFHLIQSVDHFVFYDDVQYSRGRSWRNRNQVIVGGQPKWLTVPVEKSAWHKEINQVQIREPFAESHWNLVREGYRGAPFFAANAEFARALFSDEPNLCDLTVRQTRAIAEHLGIRTATSLSSALGIRDLTKTDRLVEVCKRLGATGYVSGPTARDYIEEEKFVREGIKLEFFEYRYPEYPQLGAEFTHYVSVLDMIFNLGAAAPDYIWGGK